MFARVLVFMAWVKHQFKPNGVQEPQLVVDENLEMTIIRLTKGACQIVANSEVENVDPAVTKTLQRGS